MKRGKCKLFAAEQRILRIKGLNSVNPDFFAVSESVNKLLALLCRLVDGLCKWISSMIKVVIVDTTYTK